MSGSLSLILDDDSDDFTYTGGEWTISPLYQWYKGTSRFPAFATGSTLGSFSLSFEGTSVAFIGNTPPAGSSQSAAISIDGGAPIIVNYGGAPPSYMEWYKSPSLPDGKHTINVGNLATTSVDFAVITAGENTPLSGKTVLVDDGDSAIAYSGSWTEISDGFDAGTLPDGLPLGKGTHRSSKVGDSLSFRFTGTSASVYGIFNWANLGVLSATYAVDGEPSSQSYSVTTSSPEFVSQDKEASNFLLFSSANLSVGDHELIITITQCTNQAFVLDYITYTPSFSTLASMPNLSPGAPNTSGTTPTPLSQTPDSNSASPTTTSSSSPTGSESVSPSSSAGAVVPTQNSSNSHSTNVPVGVIVAVILCSFLLLALLALFLLLRRRRRIENLKRFPAEYPVTFPRNESNSLHSTGQDPPNIFHAVRVSPFAKSHEQPTFHEFSADSRLEPVSASHALAVSNAPTSVPQEHSQAISSAETHMTTISRLTSDFYDLLRPPSYQTIPRRHRSLLPS